MNAEISDIFLHKYQTNYRSKGKDLYSVIWGIELKILENENILIGAMPHGEFLERVLCADEVVTIIDESVIKKCISSWDDFLSKWSSFNQ